MMSTVSWMGIFVDHSISGQSPGAAAAKCCFVSLGNIRSNNVPYNIRRVIPNYYMILDVSVVVEIKMSYCPAAGSTVITLN